MALTENARTPQGYLLSLSRWRAIEIAFWLATLLPFVLTPDYLSLASQIAITALFALSLDLILGYAGIVSLGHAAFFGTGAYTAGILSARYGWGEPVSGLLAAAIMAGLVGYATSFIIARFRHLALIMLTLGFGLLLGRACQQRELADRRRRRIAGHPQLEPARRFPFRPLRHHRLCLLARRFVFAVHRRAPADQLAVRPVAARHPRELGAHAGDRRRQPLRISA